MLVFAVRCLLPAACCLLFTVDIVAAVAVADANTVAILVTVDAPISAPDSA